MDGVITRRIRVYGIVQGVGFRPTVSRHAMKRGHRLRAQLRPLCGDLRPGNPDAGRRIPGCIGASAPKAGGHFKAG